MLSFLNLLLLSNLLLVSDRDHFWDADRLSKTTEIVWDSLASAPPIDKNEVKDKKVLLVVHGFNNTSMEAIQAYRVVADHIAALKDGEGKPLYDVIIGYLWPGCDDRSEYYSAKRNARKLKEKLKGHLMFLASKAAKVDVMAHSMGNCLMFEALNFSPKKNAKKLIQNFYSLAAAVDNESIEKKKKYFQVTKTCEDIYIFHSKQDDVLEFLYSVAEWDKALGFEGAENLEKLPKNVQLIDCTTFITGHSQYFTSSNIYAFIRSEILKQTPTSEKAPNIKLLSNGDIEVISNEKKDSTRQSLVEMKK